MSDEVQTSGVLSNHLALPSRGPPSRFGGNNQLTKGALLEHLYIIRGTMLTITTI